MPYFFSFLLLPFADVCDMDDEALPLQLDSHAFVLCDRSNRDLHWTTQEEEEANAGEQKVKRRDSLTSRASSKMSAVSTWNVVLHVFTLLVIICTW